MDFLINYNRSVVVLYVFTGFSLKFSEQQQNILKFLIEEHSPIQKANSF